MACPQKRGIDISRGPVMIGAFHSMLSEGDKRQLPFRHPSRMSKIDVLVPVRCTFTIPVLHRLSRDTPLSLLTSNQTFGHVYQPYPSHEVQPHPWQACHQLMCLMLNNWPRNTNNWMACNGFPQIPRTRSHH